MSSVYGSENVNTFSPSFRLDVNHLLQDLTECDREDEVSRVSTNPVSVTTRTNQTSFTVSCDDNRR